MAASISTTQSKSNIRRLILWPVFVVILIGCLVACSVTGGNQKSTLTHVAASLQYYDPRLNPVNNDYYPSELLLSFPLISGAIFGRPSKESLLKVHLEKTARFDLALHDIESKVAALAAPLNAGDGNTGLQLNPSTAKIARLSNYAYDTLGRTVGAGSFVDPQSKAYLMLVYFSEPARLHGTVKAGADKFTFNALVQGSGFYWLRVVEVEPKSFEIRADVDFQQSVHFAVQVRDSAHL